MWSVVQIQLSAYTRIKLLFCILLRTLRTFSLFFFFNMHIHIQNPIRFTNINVSLTDDVHPNRSRIRFGLGITAVINDR